MDKKFARKAFNAEIENHLANMKMQSSIDKLDPVHLTQNAMGTADAEFGITSGFEPFNRISDENKMSPKIPLELRNLFNRHDPEMQNIFNPVFDEVTR